MPSFPHYTTPISDFITEVVVILVVSITKFICQTWCGKWYRTTDFKNHRDLKNDYCLKRNTMGNTHDPGWYGLFPFSVANFATNSKFWRSSKAPGRLPKCIAVISFCHVYPGGFFGASSRCGSFMIYIINCYPISLLCGWSRGFRTLKGVHFLQRLFIYSRGMLTWSNVFMLQTRSFYQKNSSETSHI